MEYTLIVLILVAAFASILTVESNIVLRFEKRGGSVWYHENLSFSDCNKVRRSALCKDITSRAKPLELGLSSLNVLSSLAHFSSPGKPAIELSSFDKLQLFEISNCAETANLSYLLKILVSLDYKNRQLNNADPNTAKALNYACILSALTHSFAMSAYLDTNLGDEYDVLKYAYWLGWDHFKEFAAEMDRELDFESLVLVHDIMEIVGENDTRNPIVEIPTSFCSREDIFFLISLKSAADLESRLTEFDSQRQFEIFKCANVTRWVHFERFTREHNFIVDYKPDSIFSVILGDLTLNTGVPGETDKAVDPNGESFKTVLTTTQSKDSIVKHRWIKNFVAERSLNTIVKIANFYGRSRDLTLLLLSFVSDELVIDLGTCGKGFASSFCTMYHDGSLCDQVLAILVERTKCRFQIDITHSRALHKALGLHFPHFLARSQIRISNLRDPEAFFDHALVSTVPIAIEEFIEPMGRERDLLRYILIRKANLNDFLRVIRIKDLNILTDSLNSIISEQLEILSIVDTISIKLFDWKLVSNKFQKSLQTIKMRYPQILIKLECIWITGNIGEDSMNEFTDSLRLFSSIKEVSINSNYHGHEGIKLSTRVIQELAQIHPKIDILSIWIGGFKSESNSYLSPTILSALPEFDQLKLEIATKFIDPILGQFLEKMAQRLTLLYIHFVHDKKIPTNMPKSWPFITDLTVYNYCVLDHLRTVCETKTYIITDLQMASLKTVTVIRSFGKWSDRQIMTKEEYHSIKC